MKLVDDWRRAWRWWSVQLGAIGNALLIVLLSMPDLAREAWVELPPELRAMLPERVAYWVPVALLLASMIARVIQQGEKENGD